MRRNFPIVAASLALALLSGCDQQAAQQNAAQGQIDRALNEMRVANQGYLPDNSENGQANYENLAQFRQAKLSQAIEPLRQVIDGEASERQQQTAAELLSDILASSARYHAKSAMREFSLVRTESGKLLGLVDTATSAASSARSYQRNPEALAGQLESQASDLESQAQQLRGEVQSLQQWIEQSRSEAESLRQQADERAAQAQQRRDDAFVADDSERQYNLEEQAIDLTRQSEAAEIQAEQQQVQIDAAQLRLTPMQQRLQQLESSVQSLRSQAQAIRQRGQDAESKVATAQDSQSQSANELMNQFQSLQQSFDQQVRQPFQEASDEIDQAITALQQSPESSSSDVQQQMLSRQVQKVSILTQRAIALGGLATTVDTIATAAERLGLSQADQLTQARSDLMQSYTEVAEAARTAIDSSQTLANELNTGGEGPSNQAQQITQYQQQLQNTDPNANSNPGNASSG